MKHTFYVFCEPGMDRPCFSHTPPSDAQMKRFEALGTKVFKGEVDLPGFERVDGVLQPVQAEPYKG